MCIRDRSTVFKKKVTKIFINSKNTVAVLDINKFKRHECFQSFWIKDCDFAAGEFVETLALNVSKHSSDNFPVGTKMISNRLMSDFQLVCSFDRGLF